MSTPQSEIIAVRVGAGRRSSGRQLFQAMVVVWLLVSAFLLCGISVLILLRKDFPLNVGLIRTTGRVGLLATLLPALVCLLGLSLLARFHRLGAGLVGIYALFCSILMAGGLPSVWNAQSSFCLRGLNFCITSPWMARLLVMGLSASFLVAAVWAWRQVMRSQRVPE
jgi:hypothetical protein